MLVIVLAGLFIACNNNKKDTRVEDRTEKEDIKKEDTDRDRDSKWTSGDISDFNRECKKSLDGKGLSDKQMDEVCECLLEKFEGKYDTYAEMDRKGTYEEGKQAGEECMKSMTTVNKEDNTGNWTETDKQRWMDLCDESVKNSSMTGDRKRNYCSCVLDKLMDRYANFDKMNMSGTTEEGIELGKLCVQEMGAQ
jgi:hypothetical protein